MIISEIKIKNYGPFRGLNEFKLGSINLIEGNNGSGKTCFMDAIRWCLTGIIGPDRHPGFPYSADDNSSVELILKDGKKLYKIKSSSKGITHPNKFIPNVIANFMFVSGEYLSTQVFMGDYNNFERNEELFDILFKDPIKRKAHEKILNSYLPQNEYGKDPKIKINYKDRSIEALQDSFYRGSGAIHHYQICLYLGIYSILIKKRFVFPLFFDCIFGKCDLQTRFEMSKAFRPCLAQMFFIATPLELSHSSILLEADNVIKLKRKIENE